MSGLTWKQFLNGTGEKKEVVTRFAKDYLQSIADQLNAVAPDKREGLVVRLFSKDADKKVIQGYMKELNGAAVEVDKLAERFDKAATSQEKFNSSLRSIGIGGTLGKGLKMAGSIIGNVALNLVAGAALQGVISLVNNMIHASVYDTLKLPKKSVRIP